MIRQIFQYVNFSFKRKMIVVFSTVFALLLIFTFWILYLVVSREFTDRIINDMQMILDTARDNIDYYFNDMKAPLVTIGRSPTVADLVSMKEEGLLELDKGKIVLKEEHMKKIAESLSDEISKA